MVIIAIGAVVLVRNWPFTQAAVTKTLENRFERQVVIHSFRQTFFPPGCIAEQVSFLHRKRKDLPPLITASKLTVTGSYSGLLRQRIDKVDVIGLHVTVPPSEPGVTNPVMPLTDAKAGNSIGIDKVVANDAVLEFLPGKPGSEPFKLDIQKLVLDHVAESKPSSYHAVLRNTVPPGLVNAMGKFGPWNSTDPGATPMSGSYSFDNGNLAAFHGVSGVLSAKGSFNGAIRQAETMGTVDVRGFHIDGSSHTAQLSAGFQAGVDAQNGNVSLESVKSHFHRTTLESKGEVATKPGEKGKTVELELNVGAGRVEDLLLFFTSQKQASMTGAVKIAAKVQVSPGPGFLQKVRLTGDFGVNGGRFTNPQVQTPLNDVSKSAQGEKKAQEQEDPRTILSNLRGHVEARDGIATLTGVAFEMPGGRAQLEGTFNLLSEAVDIRGLLETQGKLADATSGFKALILKVATPFMKKNRVTSVPFAIKGTASNPQFGLDLDGKRKLGMPKAQGGTLKAEKG